MNSSPKKICVIGAGISGLCSIKNCVEENLHVICYEKTNDVGGLWNINRNVGKNETTVADSTVANTSKEMFAYSDFPPPADWPNFLHNKLIAKYLKMYAERYDLLKHIKFNTEILKVEQSNDYEASGRWAVYFGNNHKETFDGVMVCCGQYSKPYIPSIPGMGDFKGLIVHSQNYKNWEEYANKRVLVVGLGNSGADIAVELARTSREVYLSTHRGAWIWSKMGVRGWPTDVRYVTRFTNNVLSTMPSWIINNYFEHLLNNRMDHSNYGLKPKHRVLLQSPVFSDLLPLYISNGHLIVKEAVRRFEVDSVVFEDGTSLQFDVVIFCTGYQLSFPFISDVSFQGTKDDGVNLYKSVFSPNLLHPTLAFIGMIESMGGLGPVAEMQGRWVTKVFNNKLTLPTRNEMELDIRLVNKRNQKIYYKNAKGFRRVSYVDYMNEIADKIGCRPNILKIMLTDIRLWYAVYFGPCTAYTYRLVGSSQGLEARSTVLGTLNRIDRPHKTRLCEPAIWKPIDKILDKYLRHTFIPMQIILFYVMFSTNSNVTFWILAVVYFGLWGFFSLCTDLFFDLSTSF